ncbi:MAG: amino acid permease [Bacteroidia bacterium]|nr:amino acid permease [Bacteroidia bacterium]MDW8332772.1 amino acid permease [Bacteroidia bacterium]
MINKWLRKKTDFEAEKGETTGLKRTLGLWDLTSLGIAAIIGAGIFSTIGKASFEGGPAVTLLFVFTAVACAFSALCYAEFASAIPIAGSAYTYAYAAFGEIVAWIIGWDLIIEYAIGNIAIAISWSDYFTGLLSSVGWDWPAWLSMDYLSAHRTFPTAQAALAAGTPPEALPEWEREAYLAWTGAPQIGGLRLIADLPALLIVVLITGLLYIGVKESKTAGNIMVAVKMAILLMVVAVGALYVNAEHWTPFAPNGFTGVMKGVAAVFFAYIGFDALSTTAEECRDPARDLPRAMILALVICTVLYVILALILTGLAPHTLLNVGDPLAFVFKHAPMPDALRNAVSAVVAVGAIVAMTGVLLVFQMGQPRIWFSMSRDGLLPQRFARIHPKFRTPSFSTVVTGVLVAVPSLFMNLTEVTDLSSLGTLFAFALVCGGVIRLRHRPREYRPKFEVPYINARYFMPPLYLAVTAGFVYWFDSPISRWLLGADSTRFPLPNPITPYVFLAVFTALAYGSVRWKWSLIPVLGVSTCVFLMAEVPLKSWALFVVWLVAGLALYFSYGVKNSKLNAPTSPENGKI